MSTTKESSSVHQSINRSRSVAENVSVTAKSLPAVAEKKEETSDEKQSLQLKSFAGGDAGSPGASATNPFNQNRGNGLSMPAQFKVNNSPALSSNGTGPGPFKPVQRKENKTGMPDGLKSGIEQMSGYDMGDVKVHYNSPQPSQLNAHAYAQGTDIHVAPGQEKHVPHEAWHVVQQKQGRVKATMQMKQGVPVNDDTGLEQEADVMGAKALQGKFDPPSPSADGYGGQSPVQRFAPAKQSHTGDTTVQRKVSIIPHPPLAPKEMLGTDVASLNQSPAVSTVITTWIGDDEPRQFQDQVKLIKAASQHVHTTSFDGSLQSLAGELDGLSGAKMLTDDSLWDILKRGFEANWFKAKSVLAFGRWPSSVSAPHPSHENCIDLMEALVEMRTRKWDEFYKKHLPLAKIQLNDPTLEIPPPDGSQSVTSDIDLSVKGAQSEAALAYFNANFKTEFGVAFEPGTVFDINMYSMDWMHGGTETVSEADSEGAKTATIVPKQEQNLEDVNLAGLAERSDTQETWSYVKIMRNLTTEEIETYRMQVLEAFEDGTPAYIKMAKKLDDAEAQTIAFKTKVEERAEEMSQQFNADMRASGFRTARSQFTHATEEHDTEEHYREEALKMRASNAIYQELAAEVKLLRNRIKIVKAGTRDAEGKSIENLATLLANKIAEALTYANEVYASEGGVLHTVYGKQKADKKKKEYAQTEGKKDIKHVKTVLNKQQYIQSINENVGDSVHALNHFSHMPKYAVFRSGKYLDRLCEATELLDDLLHITAASTFANYTKLKNIGTVAAEQKNGAIGQDPLAANTVEPFSGYDSGKVSELKMQILTFGAQATSHYNLTG